MRWITKGLLCVSVCFGVIVVVGWWVVNVVEDVSKQSLLFELSESALLSPPTPERLVVALSCQAESSRESAPSSAPQSLDRRGLF